MTDKNAEAAQEQLKQTIATTATRAAVAPGRELDAKQQERVETTSTVAAERLAQGNIVNVPDPEKAAAGFVRAGEKLTGVDPITGDALAAKPKASTAIELLENGEPKPDIQRLGEEENARTEQQQAARASKRAGAKAPTPGA